MDDDQYVVEQRTSVMAILSLVLGIVCVPFFGVVAAVLGIAALFGISSSGGRVGGRGLAIAGIILGLLASMIWVGVYVGASKMSQFVNQAMVGPIDATMKAIEAGDFATAKANFVSPTLENIKDSDFEAFRAAYRAELGEYQSAPTGFLQFASEIGQMGQAMNQFQGGSQMMPMPLTFSKDKALAGIQFPNSGGQRTNATLIPVTNIKLITKSGKSFLLYDPNTRPLPAGGTPVSPAPTPPQNTGGVAVPSEGPK